MASGSNYVARNLLSRRTSYCENDGGGTTAVECFPIGLIAVWNGTKSNWY